MYENPYQSPTTIDLGSTSRPQHRSFRLTAATDVGSGESTAGAMADAVRFTLIQQIPVLIYTSMLLDGGSMFKGAAVAAITFWAGFAIMMIRRGANCLDSDILLIKWGFLPTCLITYNAWHIISRLVGIVP